MSDPRTSAGRGSAVGRGPGAVRSEAARTAILLATAELFASRGYENLTIEGIAAQARVGKQTIYRWWPSKSALVSECLLEGMLLPERVYIPDTGCLRADMIEWVGRLLGLLREPEGRSLFTSLIAAATDNVEIGRRLRDSLGGEESLEGRFATAIAAGQLDPEAPVREVGEALVGSLILKAISGTQIEADDAELLVDAIGWF